MGGEVLECTQRRHVWRRPMQVPVCLRGRKEHGGPLRDSWRRSEAFAAKEGH